MTVEDPRLAIRRQDGSVRVTDGDTVLLEGVLNNGTLELAFGAESGIEADFMLHGESEGQPLRLAGAGSLRIDGVPIEAAAVDVSPEGLTLTSPQWGVRPCRLELRRRPGRSWQGTLLLRETVPCVLTPAAPLTITLHIERLSPRPAEVRCVVELGPDEVAFEFGADPSVDALAAEEYARIRAMALEGCEARLLERIAELGRSTAASRTDPTPDPREVTRETALRHAGLLPRAELVPGPDRRAARTQFVPAPLAVPAGGSPGAAGYIPENRAPARSSDAALPADPPAAFGRGAYVGGDPGLPLPGFPVPPSSDGFPALASLGSTEHEAMAQLLRCKDLLRALRTL